MTEENPMTNATELATELTIAWLANPNTRATTAEIPEFLKAMHAAVEALGTNVGAKEGQSQAEQHVPAVTPRRSLASKDHIISLIDGKPYKTLRRHLSTHGLTPDDYRRRYGLKKDYPIVAPAYAEMRRAMAKKIGLGRKAGEKRDAGSGARAESAPTPATLASPAPAARRGRKPKAAMAKVPAAASAPPKRRGRKPKTV